MQSMKHAFIGAAMLAGGMWSASAANAQQIYVVDSRAALTQTSAGQQMLNFLRTKTDEIEKAVGALQERAQAEATKLQQDKNLIDKATFESRRKAFEEKITRARDQIEGSRQEILQFQREATSRIAQTLEASLSEIVAGRGGGVVIDASVVRHIAPNFDLTEAAVKRIDTLLPRLEK